MPDPDAEATNAFMQNWAKTRGPMALDLSLPEQNKEARSENGGTTMAIPTLISSTSC